MYKEYTSIFHEETIVEARDTFSQIDRANRILKDDSRKSNVDKHDDKVYDSLSKKDKVTMNAGAKRDRAGNGTGKDMDNLAKYASAVDSSMRHERRHGAKHESSLLNFDMI